MVDRALNDGAVYDHRADPFTASDHHTVCDFAITQASVHSDAIDSFSTSLPMTVLGYRGHFWLFEGT